MRNAFRKTTFLLITCAIILACKKKTEDPLNFTINDQGITGCPVGSTCHFQYTNNASMTGNLLNFTTGQHRIFWARIQGDGRTSWLYMLAPMVGDKFVLNDADVKAGRVKYFSSCPACLSVELKALSGTVKGIKIPQSGNLPAKWLLDADIQLAVEGADQVFSKLSFKQYYELAVQ